MAVLKSIAKLFGVNAPETASISVREVDPTIPAGAYPTINPKYVFSMQMLKKMLFFLTTDGPRKNLLLMGDTGTGKTSLVEQVAARLGIPVFSIACSGKMRVAHLLGSYELRNGNTVRKDGPLLLAMRHDGVFLADEITRLDHSEQMALAHLLDSGVITVPETGEIVTAGPQFRFIATGNSGGFGDESGAYNGEKVASAAFLDRFQKFKVDYLGEDDEKTLLASIAPELGGELIGKMVNFARRVRESFISRGGDLRVTISTRSLVVWALETVRYGQSGLSAVPVTDALGDTILNGAPESDVKSLTEIWENWIS